MKEMRVLSRAHFFDLLDNGREEFRIETTTPGKSKRVISEDAPFDKNDPMSYVLVNTIFDQIKMFAKGEFSAHDIAEAERVYGGTISLTLQEQINELRTTVAELQKQLIAA